MSNIISPFSLTLAGVGGKRSSNTTIGFLRNLQNINYVTRPLNQLVKYLLNIMSDHEIALIHELEKLKQLKEVQLLHQRLKRARSRDASRKRAGSNPSDPDCHWPNCDCPIMQDHISCQSKGGAK